MKIKVSKKMVSELNKAARAAHAPFKFYHCTDTPEAYALRVDYDIYSNADHDYDAETGLMKYIRVEYAPELYAVSQYLTTITLNKIFYNGMTAADYFDAVIDYVSI